MAARLNEAKRVKETLNANGGDYEVELELYWVLSIFASSWTRTGAAFYVEADKADFCRNTLLSAGLGIGIIDEPIS
jgi:hypothetical protein